MPNVISLISSTYQFVIYKLVKNTRVDSIYDRIKNFRFNLKKKDIDKFT